MITPRITVGYDGSPESRIAAQWAAGEAERTHSTLQLVNAYEFAGGSTFYGVPAQAAVADRAEVLLSDLAVELRVIHPSIDVFGTAVHGNPVQTLVDLGVGSRLLVVGHRGAGGFAGLLLGSVSQQVALHASVPVAVVRGRADAPDGSVLVGVDGSAASEAALDLAFEAARSRRARLLAVRAYVPPTPPGHAGHTPILIPKDVVVADEQAALDASLAPWRGKYPTVAVDAELVAGKAAKVLVERSYQAQLAVVGSRGHGGFVGLLLGSVGQQLLHHAACPVVIGHQHD